VEFRIIDIKKIPGVGPEGPTPGSANYAITLESTQKAAGGVVNSAALSVMPGLVPGIHVFGIASKGDVDGRDKPGHDERNNPFSTR
jgi:hypothetical protein